MALNETDILGGKAIIFQNDFDIWQFRTWVSEEKQYVRISLRTKDKHQATNDSEDMYFQIISRIRNNEFNKLELNQLIIISLLLVVLLKHPLPFRALKKSTAGF